MWNKKIASSLLRAWSPPSRRQRSPYKKPFPWQELGHAGADDAPGSLRLRPLGSPALMFMGSAAHGGPAS
jgi:hypothetical protein